MNYIFIYWSKKFVIDLGIYISFNSLSALVYAIFTLIDQREAKYYLRILFPVHSY
jgi:hypothetical protein